MNELTLLVMAAGMGSRYGGLKQLDTVGPNGETIIDYSVHDAIKASFTKVVFIIRRDFETEFKAVITDKYAGKIKVEFAFQDLHDLPEGFECPAGRKKPWGTGHAILAASELINEPFVAINGDDFYGSESFNVVAEYYRSGADNFSMVGFQLNNTLSQYGGVTRGLCTVNNSELDTVIETSELRESLDGITSDRDIKLNGTETVSMNVWGFTPKLFDYLKLNFIEFLKKDGGKMKSEFLIPTVVNDLIQNGKESVHVLRSGSRWFGVTYKQDRPYVMQQISDLIVKGVYPSQLF